MVKKNVRRAAVAVALVALLAAVGYFVLPSFGVSIGGSTGDTLAPADNVLMVGAEVRDSQGNVVRKLPVKSGVLQPLALSFEGVTIPEGGCLVFYPIVKLAYREAGVAFKTKVESKLDLGKAGLKVPPTQTTDFKYASGTEHSMQGLGISVSENLLLSNLATGETKTMRYDVTVAIEAYVSGVLKETKTGSAYGEGKLTRTDEGVSSTLSVVSTKL